MKNNEFAIRTIFFTVFLDLLGLVVIIPILPALLLDPINGIVPATSSFSTRTMLCDFHHSNLKIETQRFILRLLLKKSSRSLAL
ncbi:MAG: hypothetical protein JJE18_06085 [Eubacteriaceae bacterium]|nr:hypothetical protein [Eubacteriaceae bacterium]